jgi:hypothetical protein
MVKRWFIGDGALTAVRNRHHLEGLDAVGNGSALLHNGPALRSSCRWSIHLMGTP